MTIAFEELEGSPVIAVGADGTTARRVFRVAWADWPQFVRDLIGSYRRAGTDYYFIPPLEFPGLPGVVVSSLEVSPFDPGNPDGTEVSTLTSGTNSYPAAGAKITADYEALPADDEPSRGELPATPSGTYLTYRADLGSEFHTTSSRGWHWDTAGSPPLAPDVNPGIVIPTGVFRLIWQRVVAPNWTAIRQLRGKVNDAPFVGAAAGTVLFLGARVVRQFEFGEGMGFWRVEYLFSERAIELAGGGLAGWNHAYKEQAVNGEHWLPLVDEDGNGPYAAADLTPLFEFGTG
ncbi:MAG: hypothetical protein K8T25_08555 [Planctomycetia bacterium]|nr:hypothetical protein [Planctomycetia bacterium]